VLEVATIVAALAALALWGSVPRTAALAGDNPSTTAFIELRRAEAEAAGKPFDLRWQWRPLGAISRYLRAAVIYAEDYNFYRHDGVDWRALEHAVSADWNKGAMAVGGSTITQQLAKNLYLSPRRSLVRKLREILIASSLEDHLSKQRILEIYLNVVEWGHGVFGAEAAARTWFHHSAQTLSPAEAIRLAIALPNPILRAPNVHDAELTRKGVRLTRMLRMQGLIDAAQERATLDELGAPDEHVLPEPAVPPPDRPAPAGSAAAPAPTPSGPRTTEPAPAPSGPTMTDPAPAPSEPRTTEPAPAPSGPPTTEPTPAAPAAGEPAPPASEPAPLATPPTTER
jgi:monofunctional biosynthetic peptidoglycan transglycosylase